MTSVSTAFCLKPFRYRLLLTNWPIERAVRPVLVVLVQVLGSQFQAVGASGHQGRVVCEDRGHGVVAAQGAVPGAVVDHPAVFVRRIVSLRSLVHQGRRLKAFRGVVAPAPWVAEGELCVLGEGVQVIAAGDCSEPGL